MADFGSILRQKRKEAKLTQAELGDKIGVSKQVVSNLERGYTTGISAEMIESIASALDVPAQVFFDASSKNSGKVIQRKAEDVVGLSSMEKDLISSFRKLPISQKYIVIGKINEYLDNQEHSGDSAGVEGEAVAVK